MLPIWTYREVTSTNDLALKAVSTDAPHGACWIAESQTAGRGRREIGGERRSWFSPAGGNIYMSILLRPQLEPARAAGLTLAAGVGVCEALNHECDADIWLKWPNDIYVGNKKLGGVLTEASTSADGLEAVIIGIGLNVNLDEEDIPEELREVMTSIRLEVEHPIDRLRLVHPLREAVLTWCDAYVHRGFETLYPAVQRHDRSNGLRVDVDDHGRKASGIARGIDEIGRLCVELADGRIERLSTGEVKLHP